MGGQSLQPSDDGRLLNNTFAYMWIQFLSFPTVQTTVRMRGLYNLTSFNLIKTCLRGCGMEGVKILSRLSCSHSVALEKPTSSYRLLYFERHLLFGIFSQGAARVWTHTAAGSLRFQHWKLDFSIQPTSDAASSVRLKTSLDSKREQSAPRSSENQAHSCQGQSYPSIGAPVSRTFIL